MSGMEPMAMAALSAGVGAATSDDPLKGALIGGIGGFAGGHLLGAGGSVGGAINPASAVADKMGAAFQTSFPNLTASNLLTPQMGGGAIPLKTAANAAISSPSILAPVSQSGMAAETARLAAQPITIGDRAQNMMLNMQDKVMSQPSNKLSTAGNLITKMGGGNKPAPRMAAPASPPPIQRGQGRSFQSAQTSPYGTNQGQPFMYSRPMASRLPYAG